MSEDPNDNKVVVTGIDDVEKGNSTATENESKSKFSKKWIIGICFVLFAFVACGVIIPIVMYEMKAREAEKSATVSIVDSNPTSKISVSSFDDYTNDSTVSTDTGSGLEESNDAILVKQTNYDSSSLYDKVEYKDIKDLFETKVEYFNINKIKGYSSNQDLESSLVYACNEILNSIHKENLMYNSYGNDFYYGDDNYEDYAMNQKNVLVKNGDTSTTSTEESNYGIHNQEPGVGEGDNVVTDGEYVYSAYGKFLVVWNSLTGSLVGTIEMPSGHMILSLILDQNRLLVIMSGNYDMQRLDGMFNTTRALLEYKGTQVRLYDTAILVSSQSESDALVGFADINGQFQSVRLVEGTAHIVQLSSTNSYGLLVGPLQRYNFGSMNNAEYTMEFEQKAPIQRSLFINQLLEDLQVSGVLSNLARIGVWQQDNADEQSTKGQLDALMLVYSLDMKSQAKGSAMVLPSTGAFHPYHSYTTVYTSEQAILLTQSIYEYNETTSYQSLSLLALSINGTSTALNSVGKLRGGMLGSYSVDIIGNILHIATTDTITEYNEMWSTVQSSVPTSFDEIYEMPRPDTTNYITILELPGSNGDVEGEMKVTGKLQLGEPHESFTAVRFFDNVAYASTFEYTDPFYVLDLSDKFNPKKVSELKINGTSRHLLSLNDDNSLILGFGEEVDIDSGSLGSLQLTMYDMSNAADPIVVHRYSTKKNQDTYVYTTALHDFKSITYADGRLVIPIEISDNSTSFRGFSVFNVDKELGIFEIEECRVQSDYKYNYYGYNNYYQHEVYDTTFTGTNESYAYEEELSSNPFNHSDSYTTYYVPTYEQYNDCKYREGSLAPRAMLMGGNLMTMEFDSIIMTNLSTCQKMWNITFSIPNPNPRNCNE